jgi:hypothetical protein
MRDSSARAKTRKPPAGGGVRRYRQHEGTTQKGGDRCKIPTFIYI